MTLFYMMMKSRVWDRVTYPKKNRDINFLFYKLIAQKLALYSAFPNIFFPLIFNLKRLVSCISKFTR